MDFKCITKFFKRFSKAKMLSLCQEYDLDTKLKKTTTNKDSLARILAQATTSGRLTVKDLERLDLQYCKNCLKIKWNVYQMLGKKDNANPRLSDPEYLQEKFEEKLNVYLRCKVGVLTDDNFFWIRISINLGDVSMLLSSTNTFYMVYIPGSSYILLSPVKMIYQSYILKAVEELFGCEVVKELPLSGKNVAALCDLVLNKTSQGYFSQFRLNKADENPLSRKRKRQISDDICDNVFNEQWSKDKKTKSEIYNTFGPNPQPALEKVEFKLKSTFCGTEYVPSFEHSTMECTVKFRGINVLEGIKNLVKLGIASYPLPSHLARIHSLTRNRFILTEK